MGVKECLERCICEKGCGIFVAINSCVRLYNVDLGVCVGGESIVNPCSSPIQGEVRVRKIGTAE